jgi:hypothetical protein
MSANETGHCGAQVPPPIAAASIAVLACGVSACIRLLVSALVDFEDKNTSDIIAL